VWVQAVPDIVHGHCQWLPPRSGSPRVPTLGLQNPPLYQILQLTSYPPAIQNFFHLPLLLSLKDHWMWWWCHLAGQWVFSRRIQERNWECSVFLDCCRYIQLVGIGPYGSDDTVRSVVLILQLPARVCSSSVASINPNQIAWLESGGRRAVVVSTVCLPHLGISYLRPGNFMDAFQSFRCHLSFPLLWGIHSYIQLEVITWLVPKVAKNGDSEVVSDT